MSHFHRAAKRYCGAGAVDASNDFMKTAPHAVRLITRWAWYARRTPVSDMPEASDGFCTVSRMASSNHPAQHGKRAESPGDARAFSTDRRQVKNLRNPQRIEFYHRRHREIKKFEKNQDRIHHLRAIAHERGAVGRSRLAEAAASEADRLEMPWLASNLPIKPPIYASVSQGGNTSAKVSNLSAVCEAAKAHPKLDVKEETRSLDVLNLKVGYAVDAQYALPHEVKAFVLDQTTFCLYGVDKNQVTQIASNIRRIRPPEPYKGSGVRIVGETIKLKERKVK